MVLTFPYTYISCPCADGSGNYEDSRLRPAPLFHKQPINDGSPEEEAAFDPHNLRASFSLFPPQHLLYCEECQDIKCPRCIIEEQVSLFCTSCLFETPSSAARGEGNRCARNCFNCPICFSQLSVNSTGETARDGPWVLNCNYCMWTSLDIGITLDRPTNIRAQLDKIANGGKPKAPPKSLEATDPGRRSSYLSRESYSHLSTFAENSATSRQEDFADIALDQASRFAALKSFYKNQLTTTSTDDSSISSLSGDISYSSPASLTRIMNLYSTSGSFQPKKKAQTPLMREALYASEGCHFQDPAISSAVTFRIRTGGLSNTASLEQRRFQTGPSGGNPNSRFVDELRPMPAPLTSKRAKRCKECKHILVKPDSKPTSTRYRIRLVALSYIPHISIKPIPGHGVPVPTGPLAMLGSDLVLEPGKPTQWALTLENPLFDPVRVSLATPTVTPGRYGHKVTILCPQFEIGASSDMWDEALNTKTSTSGGRGSGSSARGPGAAEAGKVYETGKNWTSVVLEVEPVAITTPTTEVVRGSPVKREDSATMEQDGNLLEIPDQS